MKSVAAGSRGELTLAWTAKFSIHVAMLFVGFILAYELRRALPLEWWLTSPDAGRVIRWAVLFTLIGASVELVFQSERSAWRFASMREFVGLARNVTVTAVLFLLFMFFINRGFRLPRSILPLAWLVSLALLVGCRLIWRLPHDPSLAAHFLPSWWHRPVVGRTPLLVVGSMAAADRQLRMLQADPNSPYQAVGVITPNSDEVGLRLHGVPFVAELASWLPAHSGLVGRGAVPHAIVFLDDPLRAYGFSTERIGELRRAGHALLKPQSLGQIDGPSAENVLSEIPLEDFLPRKPISLDPAPLRNLVEGRRVLVTGAGGSIGSELCRQLLRLGCAHLSMLDHSEFLLFEIDRELGAAGGGVSRRAILANVRDAERISNVVESERPDIVFHAAALKHVALVENNPVEGILTNVLGTWNVMKATVAHGVDQFVLISTDKAVAPTNVMGGTKRLAEALLDLAPDISPDTKARMTAVRFGNVLGSAGSVVPIFRDQIARGGPVTVTHPEVNRFFMTIPEAVQLVLHSAALGAASPGGAPRKFLLEMGEPVKIADLARQMIELSGKVPDVDVMIEFTGLKPGEKLAEILSDAGEEVKSCVDGIMEVRTASASSRLQYRNVEQLVELSLSGEQDARGLVFKLLDELGHRASAVPRTTTVISSL